MHSARPWLPLALLLLTATAALAQPPLGEKAPDVLLSNGMRVMGCEDRSTDLVGVYLAVKVGAVAETGDLAGARDLLQECFRSRLEQAMRGQRQYLDLSNALLVGRGLSLSTEWDYVSLVTLCPRSELRALLQVIGQSLFVDPLTDAALAAGRAQVTLQGEQGQADPAESTFYLFRRALLGDTPAARPVYPDPAALDKLTMPVLQTFRDRYYVPSNALLVIVGPDSPDQLVAEAVEAMTAIPRRPAPGGWLPDFPLQAAGTQMVQNPNLHGVASLMVGFRFPPLTDPDFPASLVLYEILAGREGLVGTDAKFKATLSSALAGFNVPPEAAVTVISPVAAAVPFMAVHVQCAPDAISQVQQALVNALFLARDKPTSEEALSRARRRAINAVALSGFDQQERARRLGEWALFARSWAPLERLPQSIGQVSQADLTRVATRIFARQYVGLQMPE
jgi:zinc protease